MTAGERGSRSFDVEGFARRLSAGQGEITYTAPLPAGPPEEFRYPQHVCAVGLGPRTLTVTVAAFPAEEAHQWMSEQGAYAEQKRGRRTDLGNGMVQWEFALEDEAGSLYEHGLAYRAGRYVVEVRLDSHDPIDEANGDTLRVAALETMLPLTEDEWGR